MIWHIVFGKIHSYPEIRTILLEQNAVFDDLIDALTKKIQVPDEELKKIIEAFSLPEAEEK